MKLPSAFTPNLRFLLGLLVAFAGVLREGHAQVTPQLNPDQLDQLMGPIALYPDALVALILPASTVPTEIVLAQRYLSTGGNPDQIDDQPWSDSVKGLARYPMLIQWLDENLTWTQQLGGAFLNQPDEIMESVQRLRARARANGTLTSTPQQKVVLDGDIIEIVPAQPDVIYVPYYDPNLVYGQPVYYGGPPYVTFGIGFGVGYWLAYDMNWHNHVVVVGDRHHNWYEHHDWNHHSGHGGKPNYGSNWRQWTPPANSSPHSRPDSHRSTSGVAQPRPFPSGGSSYSHPERPRPDNNSRSYDHNRPSAPPTNSDGNHSNRDHRPPSTSGPQSAPQPQAGPPVPAPNPQGGNVPLPSGPATTSSPVPRPDMSHPHSNPTPRPPGSVPPRQPQTRPYAPVPGTVPPTYPVAPQPSAPPPPPAKDQPRDEKPEVQR